MRRAAFYGAHGAGGAVLQVAMVERPEPAAGEVRVRLATSGVNPSDVKSRAGTNRKMAYPRVIPHSDGAGTIDAVGAGVDPARIGERVWIWKGQWRLEGWQNQTVFLAVFVLALWQATRRGYSFVELISQRLDSVFVSVLCKWRDRFQAREVTD